MRALPVELHAELRDARSEHRRRLLERRARAPVDVDRGVRVHRVEQVEEQPELRAIGGEAQLLLDAEVEHGDGVLAARADRLDEDDLRRAVVQRRREMKRPYGAPLCIFSTGVTRRPQPASTVPENFAFQLVYSFCVGSFGVQREAAEVARTIRLAPPCRCGC